MKRILWFCTLLCICILQFANAVSVQIVNNKANGFQAIFDGKVIQLDENPRNFSKHEISQASGLVYLKYIQETVIPSNGLIILKDGRVLFDSKQKLRDDGHPYMERINKNCVYSVRSTGGVPSPELHDYDPKVGRAFDENNYTYRTQIVENKILIDINTCCRYERFVRFIYDTGSFRLLAISNQSGAISEDRYPIGRIEDPDGYTNVRSGPGKQYPVIIKVNEGDIFAVTSTSGDWFQIIMASGKTGYMHKSRIRIIPKTSEKPGSKLDLKTIFIDLAKQYRAKNSASVSNMIGCVRTEWKDMRSFDNWGSIKYFLYYRNRENNEEICDGGEMFIFRQTEGQWKLIYYTSAPGWDRPETFNVLESKIPGLTKDLARKLDIEFR